MDNIDLIVPAYNEEHRIRPMLLEYLEYFNDDLAITVVLNGCTDNTKIVVETLQQKYPNRLSLLEFKEAIGKGKAVIEGWKHATAPILGFVDADASTSANEFEKILHSLNEYDGIIGSRFMKGGIVINRQSPLRTIMSRFFAYTVKFIFHLPYADTQCGAKIFRRETVLPILDTLKESSMVFDVELLWKLKKANIAEIPTYWVDKEGSSSLGKPIKFFKTGIEMVTALFRIRFSK